MDFFDDQLTAPRSEAVIEGLPEVRAAIADGWSVAPDAPMWVYLPALWPRSARAWLPDRSTHYMTTWCTGQPSRRVPWTAEVAAEVERDANSDLQNCGLPARPPNRIWLLRPPPQYPDVERTLGHLIRAARRDGVDAPMLSRAMVDTAVRDGGGGRTDGQPAEIVGAMPYNLCMALHWKLVIDTVNAPVLADFWAAALGYEVEDQSTLIGKLLAAGHIDESVVAEHRGRKIFRGYAAIRHPDDLFDQDTGIGQGRRLLFQDVPEPKTVKNRLHIDVHAEPGGLDALVERLESLGATRVREIDQGLAGHWWVMRDPEGNEFCAA